MRRSLLIAVALVTLTSPALAKHRHRHPAHHVRPIGAPVGPASFWSFFQGAASVGSDVVSAARAELGKGAVYGRSNLWCARFMNYVLSKTGHHGTGSDMARSFAALPKTDMHVGAIAVMSRRGGGHVGVVSGIDSQGNPIVISGNHGGRVRESVYSRQRVVAFVSPQ